MEPIRYQPKPGEAFAEVVSKAPITAADLERMVQLLGKKTETVYCGLVCPTCKGVQFIASYWLARRILVLECVPCQAPRLAVLVAEK